MTIGKGAKGKVANAIRNAEKSAELPTTCGADTPNGRCGKKADPNRPKHLAPRCTACARAEQDTARSSSGLWTDR